jgi:hypothetical protein
VHECEKKQWDTDERTTHVIESHDTDAVSILQAMMLQTACNFRDQGLDLCGRQVAVWIAGIKIELKHVSILQGILETCL